MNGLEKDPAKISSMFSGIAHRYDLLNRVLSLGIDRYWRRSAVSQLPKLKKPIFLDVATGTGDVAIEIAKKYSPDVKIIGVDFSDKMLELGKEKARKAGYQSLIELCLCDATSLPFKDNTFDAAIVAFGIRNVQDYKQGIKEMGRVVKNGKKVVILEFANIQNRFFKLPYNLYITKIIPFVGNIVLGKKEAYKYLPSSMLDFPSPDKFKKIMEAAGLQEVKYYKLTLGIAVVYVGTKK